MRRAHQDQASGLCVAGLRGDSVNGVFPHEGSDGEFGYQFRVQLASGQQLSLGT